MNDRIAPSTMSVLAAALMGCGRIGFDIGEPSGETGPWTSTTSLPVVREQLATTAYNGYLFATGGDDGISDNGSRFTFSAPINADGTVGTWSQDADSLYPTCIYRHSAAVAKGYLILPGGSCSGNPQSQVYVAPIEADGAVGTFAQTPNMPAGRRRHTTWVVNDHVFVAGGSNPGFDTVFSGHVDDNGVIATWITNTNVLPGNRFRHASALANGFAYVIGGQDELATFVDTVFYAKVNDDGTTDAWQTSANPLPVPLAMMTSFIANDYCYVVGGYDGAIASSSVYYAKLNPDGSNEPWQLAREALPEPRMFHALTVVGDYVYVTGGDTDATFGGATSTVYMLSLPR